MEIHRTQQDVTVLNDMTEIPGLGFLPVNAFVIHAEQPVVIDTGMSTEDKDFVTCLGDAIDPADVRWIWLTHPDRDHTGGLFSLLDAAPQARVVTTFLGVGILSCERPLPMDRVYLLNPGQQLDVGDRTLSGLRPPLFDSPATVGVVDHKTGALFSSDCFGGPMPTAEAALAGDAREVGPDDLRAAQLLWAGVDSPWVHEVRPEAFRATIDPIQDLDPTTIFSTHLPPARGLNRSLLDMLHEAPDSPPFVGPDQAVLEAMLATFEPPTPVGV
jgi:glyoxylase-like metal-dependent hydrolase (beta-lactamase superfamily II)